MDLLGDNANKGNHKQDDTDGLPVPAAARHLHDLAKECNGPPIGSFSGNVNGVIACAIVTQVLNVNLVKILLLFIITQLHRPLKEPLAVRNELIGYLPSKSAVRVITGGQHSSLRISIA